MGKSKTGLPKHQRIVILINLLAKSRKLRKAEIDQKFSEIADVDPEEVSRLLHDDLKFLVEEGEVFVRYFSPDGSEASEDSRNKIGEWYIEENSKDKILGYGDLVSAGFSINVSRSLYTHTTFDSKEKSKALVIGLPIKGKIYFLNVSLDAVPFKILFARNINVSEEIPFSDIETKYGKRVVLLGVPNTNVTSLRKPELSPHLEIGAGESNVTLIDHESTNGSFFKNVSQKLYREKIEKILSTNNKTITQTVFSLEKENEEEKVAEQFSKKEMIEKLGVVFLSKGFCFSVLESKS